MGVITWSPLDGGFLSGKYRKPEDLIGENRIAFFSRRIHGSFDPQEWWIRRKLEAVGELAKLAEEIHVTLPQMATAFAIEHPGVTSAIIGPRTMDQLEGVLAGGTLKLSAETLDRIDALAPPGTTLNPLIDVPSGTTKTLLRRN